MRQGILDTVLRLARVCVKHELLIPFPQDTRALIVREIFNVEKSYVDSLQFLVIVSTLLTTQLCSLEIQTNFQKYLTPLKNPENSHIIDNVLVDDIFFQVSK